MKKVLDEAHINLDDVFDKDLDISLANENEIEIEDKESDYELTDTSLSQDTESFGNYSINNYRLGDNLKPKASRLKLGYSEICIGRIEYRTRSSIRLSRNNSIRSLRSNVTTSSNSSTPDLANKKANFFLGNGSEHLHDSTLILNNENDLHIPDPILEEDERYMSIQKKPSEDKIIPVFKIFENVPEK